MAETVQGLAATRARSFGGEVAANLVAASFTHVSQELVSTKKELLELQSKLESSKEELSAVKIEKAVLSERLSTLGRMKHFTNIALAFGILIVGFGVDQMRGTNFAVGCILFGVGTIFIFVAWFSSPAKQ